MPSMQIWLFGFLPILTVGSANKEGNCPTPCRCDDTQRTMACIAKNLTEIPLGVDEVMVDLDLTGNSFQILPRDAFVHTPQLTHLSLQGCSVVTVKEGAFRGLSRVVYLNLAYNRIDILYQESFDGLLALKELHLDHNRIEEIRPGAFAQLGFLNMLTLAHNHLAYISNMAFQDLQHLEPLSGPMKLSVLNLTGNPIHCDCNMRPLKEWATAGGVKLLGACAGPARLSDEPLQAVTSVDLRCRGGPEDLKGEEEEEEEEEEESNGNITASAKPKQTAKCPLDCECDTEAHHTSCGNHGLNKVPQGFPPSTQLLNLQGNRFHFIPTRSFPDTDQVESLYLDFCEIHKIEAEAFCGMSSLVYLHLSNNDLTSLEPKALAGLPKLKYLHLEGNRLTQFPRAALSLVPNLSVLHLERNAISRLEPAGLLSSAAPSLMELYLGNNAINKIAKGALNSANIKTLHLDSNRLTRVPSDTLTDTPNLTELNLSENPVQWVGPKTFQEMSHSLQRLYMNRMGMEELSRETLLDLGPRLKVLTVKGNKLKTLPDMSPLSGLELIDLRDNPLICDCDLLPLRRWMERKDLDVLATCGHPLELRGQKVMGTNGFATCPENPTYLTEMGPVGPTAAKLKSIMAKKKKKKKAGKAQNTQESASEKRKQVKDKKMIKASGGN